jgi:transcriptional regulator with XRE-family HTH domain
MNGVMSFAKNRSEAGLTLADVAKEFGVTPDVARDWEDGTAQPPAHVIRSLELLGNFARPAEPPPRAPRAIPLPLPAPMERRTDSLIKSKQRVADHGEVFTPDWLVEKMLDLVKGESERIDSRFLEPACGSGNFLVPILQRKLAAVELKYDKSDFEKRHYALVGLTCCYGIELLADNIAECRANMLEVFAAYLKLDEADELYRAAAHVLALNLIHGDAMTMRDNAGDPILVVEWGYLGKGKFQRRDFRLDRLTEMAAFREEGTLFAGLGRHEVFQPTPNRYPPMTVRELAAQEAIA